MYSLILNVVSNIEKTVWLPTRKPDIYNIYIFNVLLNTFVCPRQSNSQCRVFCRLVFIKRLNKFLYSVDAIIRTEKTVSTPF